jgi:ribosomal protein S18 acetylase RimI-like enzyme
MQQDLTFRRLTHSDLEAFKSIRLEALRTEPENFASNAADWEQKSDEDWLAILSQTPIFAGFDIQNRPLAIMGLILERAKKMAHRATIVMVYTTPKARGQGLAKALLNSLINYAQSEGIVQLELQASAENPEALGFYTSQGFEQIGRIPGGFRHDGREIDDVLMARRI